MKKYTVKHLITSALLSLTALVVGYALLSLPFRLMDWLDPTQMKLVFATEFVLYITVLGLVITRREKKLAAKKAAYARRQRRRARLARQDATARQLKVSILHGGAADPVKLRRPANRGHPVPSAQPSVGDHFLKHGVGLGVF